MQNSTAKVAKGEKSEKGLADLFEHSLKDIYYAEKKIHHALPKIIAAAGDAQLKEALTSHREETAGQIERLEKIFALLKQKPVAVKCEAIEGILKEGDELLSDFGKTKTGDAAIIFSCQAVEHYEIARYGCMHMYATELGMKDIASLLEETLGQEKAADKKLTKLAEARVNYAAE